MIIEIERSLGFEPADREFERLGHDVESRMPGASQLRFTDFTDFNSASVDFALLPNSWRVPSHHAEPAGRLQGSPD